MQIDNSKTKKMADVFFNYPVPNTNTKACAVSEEQVQRECIEFMSKHGWKLIRHEWFVVKDEAKHGVGDLVFIKGKLYAVIECKKHAHENVYEQAEYYGAAWFLGGGARKDHMVAYGIWTCRVKKIMGLLQTRKDALELCKRKSCSQFFRV
jgi:hypothetical protein